MKPTPDQRRILRLFVVERVLARGFSRLWWLDPDTERPAETVAALTCAFFRVEGDQLVLTERGRWAARDMADGLFAKACAQQGRARTAWFAALDHAANPHKAPVLEVMQHAEVIMDRASLLMASIQVTARCRDVLRIWEEMVPRPRFEARMAKAIPGYVPKVPLLVCEKHRRVEHE